MEKQSIVENINMDNEISKIALATKDEFEKILAMRSNRNFGQQGVPVYLMLDDLTENKVDNNSGKDIDLKSGNALFNSILALGTLVYMKHLKKEGEEVTYLDVAEVFGVLADKYFTSLEFEEWRNEQ